MIATLLCTRDRVVVLNADSLSSLTMDKHQLSVSFECLTLRLLFPTLNSSLAFDQVRRIFQKLSDYLVDTFKILLNIFSICLQLFVYSRGDKCYNPKWKKCHMLANNNKRSIWWFKKVRKFNQNIKISQIMFRLCNVRENFIVDEKVNCGVQIFFSFSLMWKKSKSRGSWSSQHTVDVLVLRNNLRAECRD